MTTLPTDWAPPPLTTDRLTVTDVRMLARFVTRRTREAAGAPGAGEEVRRAAAADVVAVARLRKELLLLLHERDRAAGATAAERCGCVIAAAWEALATMAGPWSHRPDWDALWNSPSTITVPGRRPRSRTAALEAIRDGAAPQLTTQGPAAYEQEWLLWRALRRDDRLTDAELAARLATFESALQKYRTVRPA
ncbi:hypothetical protein ABTX81_30770 [Kitasatospora sp. NPDC097605]|uniref:hypothetical protein n=1 Tax=Kitasatospora sp. NPDC097605 TaxID=3157226 RepID=UPI0033210D5F